MGTKADFANSVLWATVLQRPDTFPPSAHTHPLSQLEQSGAAEGQVPVWDSTLKKFVPKNVSSAGPTGATGPSGAVGPAGQPGPAGPSGVPSGIFDVKKYGATGDGSSNDAAAVIAALVAAGPNSVVYFPPGTYVLSGGPIAIPSDNMRLVGYGATLRGTDQNDFRRFVFTNRSRGLIEGIAFDGLYSNTSVGLGHGAIDIIASSDISVRECTFVGQAQQGVAILGASVRASVSNSRFSSCFCAIFSNDDGVFAPTGSNICNNFIRAGLGNVTTAFSGAIKIHAGVGNSTSHGGHVVTGNVIDTTGQMGIEIQGNVNDCVVASNSVIAPGYCISISGCSKVSVIGNALKGFRNYGVEIASTCVLCSVIGNDIDATNASGTPVGDYGIEVSNSSDVVISGNTVSGTNQIAVHAFSSNTISISGNSVRPAVGACIDSQNSPGISITGNVVTATTNATVYGVVVDVSGSSGTYSSFLIANNIFKGLFGFVIVRMLSTSGSAVIDGLTVTGNDTVQATAAGGGIDFYLTGSTSYVKNVTIRGNKGPNGASSGSLDFPSYVANNGNVTAANSLNLDTILVDASGGNITITLPDAGRHFGFEQTVKKIDSSANTVTLAPASGNIDGSPTKVLSAQWKFLRSKSDGSNYFVVASN